MHMQMHRQQFIALVCVDVVYVLEDTSHLRNYNFNNGEVKLGKIAVAVLVTKENTKILPHR